MKDLGHMWTSSTQQWTKGHPLPTRDQVYSWVRNHRAAHACLEELPAAKEPRKKKTRMSVAEAKKQSQAKAHYCHVLKTAMNNLKKALEDRQHPVFIFTIRSELFRAVVHCAVVEYLKKTNRKTEFLKLSETCKTIRAELWKGDSKEKISAYFSKDVMDADVEMLQVQFTETERLVAQASRAKRLSERQVTLQKSKLMSQSRFSTIMKPLQAT